MVVPEMARWKAPPVLQLVVVLLMHVPFVSKTCDLQFVELFAGRGEVTGALRSELGWRGSAHDLEHSTYMDLCSTHGFLNLVWDVASTCFCGFVSPPAPLKPWCSVPSSQDGPCRSPSRSSWRARIDGTLLQQLHGYAAGLYIQHTMHT